MYIANQTDNIHKSDVICVVSLSQAYEKDVCPYESISRDSPSKEGLNGVVAFMIIG